jgi:hypothetical protein
VPPIVYLRHYTYNINNFLPVDSSDVTRLELLMTLTIFPTGLHAIFIVYYWIYFRTVVAIHTNSCCWEALYRITHLRKEYLFSTSRLIFDSFLESWQKLVIFCDEKY